MKELGRCPAIGVAADVVSMIFRYADEVGYLDEADIDSLVEAIEKEIRERFDIYLERN